MLIRLFGLYLLLIPLLTACGHDTAPHHQRLYVFGTLVDITIAQTDREQAEEAIDGLAWEFQRLHRQWHAWQPGPVTALNQAFAEGRTATVADSELLALLKQSQTLFTQSDGLFNPAIGKLSALWGFHGDDLPSGPPPAAEAVAALVAENPRMDDLDIHGNQVSSRNPAVQLDFGGVAKGYAVDLAIDYLRRQGIEHAIVNAGGNLRTIGRHGNRPWRIGIRHPDGTGVLASLATREDESVFTSGNYERYREYAGKRYSHILDPRTGMSVEDTVAVTVLHPSGTVADVASTALSVAGLTGWRKIAAQLEVEAVMLVDAAGTVYLTPAMAARIRFEVTPAPKVVMVEAP